MTKINEILITLKEIVIPENQNTNKYTFAGRVFVYLFFLIWGIKLINTPLKDAANSFMHNINLPIHEAGHIFFSFFGEFFQYLGGTSMQLLMPFAFVCTFLFKYRNAFGSAISLWWFGQNFLDIAPYVYDARAGELMLLGGVTGKEAPGFHDWENILGMLGWLEYDHLLANLSFALGVILMLLSLIWGGYILYLQFINLDKKGDGTIF